jgi:hypothetical protein
MCCSANKLVNLTDTEEKYIIIWPLLFEYLTLKIVCLALFLFSISWFIVIDDCFDNLRMRRSLSFQRRNDTSGQNSVSVTVKWTD